MGSRKKYRFLWYGELVYQGLATALGARVGSPVELPVGGERRAYTVRNVAEMRGADHRVATKVPKLLIFGRMRANTLLKVIVKFTVKITVCMSLRLAAYGEFDCEFDYDSQEWSCSKCGWSQGVNLIHDTHRGSERDEPACNRIAQQHEGVPHT